MLLDTLVKPCDPIPADATRIHGITDVDVAHAPTWADIHYQVCELIRGRPLVIYNAEYDLRLMRQTAARYGLDMMATEQPEGHGKQLAWAEHGAHCAMLTYAEFYGEWNDSRGNYRWQRLGNAVAQQDVEVEGQAHRALCDCYSTLGVIKAMTK